MVLRASAVPFDASTTCFMSQPPGSCPATPFFFFGSSRSTYPPPAVCPATPFFSSIFVVRCLGSYHCAHIFFIIDAMRGPGASRRARSTQDMKLPRSPQSPGTGQRTDEDDDNEDEIWTAGCEAQACGARVLLGDRNSKVSVGHIFQVAVDLEILVCTCARRTNRAAYQVFVWSSETLPTRPTLPESFCACIPKLMSCSPRGAPLADVVGI